MNIRVTILALTLLTGCNLSDETANTSGNSNNTNPSNNTNTADMGGTSDTGGSTSDTGSTSDAGSDSGATEDYWRPRPGTTWAWQLTGTIDTSVDVDVYDVDMVETSDAVFQTLWDDGRAIICYFSAGTREDYRDDADQFPSDAVGKTLPEWPDEQWLDIRDAGVREVMMARMDYAKDRGCDAIEPDNVDGYSNDTGFPLTQEDQLDYLKFLSSEAHKRGLSVGLKNAVDVVDKVVGDFDFAINEECITYDECDAVRPFIDAGKAVFHVEYVDRQEQGAARQSTVCANRSRAGFSTLIKVWDLDAWYLTCP